MLRKVKKSSSKKDSPSRSRKYLRPDDVWTRYEGQKVSVRVKLLRAENNEGLSSILLEGDRTSLKWLADTILAVAGDDVDCSTFCGPTGPGNIYFSQDSDFGIYVHCLPCIETKDGGSPL